MHLSCCTCGETMIGGTQSRNTYTSAAQERDSCPVRYGEEDVIGTREASPFGKRQKRAHGPVSSPPPKAYEAEGRERPWRADGAASSYFASCSVGDGTVRRDGHVRLARFGYSAQMGEVADGGLMQRDGRRGCFVWNHVQTTSSVAGRGA